MVRRRGLRDGEHPWDVRRELVGGHRWFGCDDDTDQVTPGRVSERPAERRDLGADLRQAAVRRGLPVDPDRACHQMILRSARKATTWRAASSAGSRITRVAARGGGASAPSTAVVAAAPPTPSGAPSPPPTSPTSASDFVSIVFERAAMIPFSDG